VLFELIKGLMKDLDGTAVDEVHINLFFFFISLFI
jgi:hypothetical protein